MQAKENVISRPKRKNKKRILKLVSAFIVVLIVSAVFLVPVIVSSEKGRTIILTKINNSLDGKIDFASLSMSWWKGIKVTDVSFNDSSGQTSVEVKQITTKPHYGSILFGRVSLGETIIDEPRVEINLKAQQPKKARDSRQKPPANKKSGPIALPIRKVDLVINNGNLKVADPQAGTVEIAQINSKLNLRLPSKRTDFDMTMVVAKQGSASKISAEGQITTKKGWTLKGTSGDLTVKVDDLDLGSLGPLLAWAGVELDAQGQVSANIKSEMKDGRFENLSADIKAKNLDLMSPRLKDDRLKTSLLIVEIELSSDKELININNLQVQADWLKAQATGVVPTTFKSLADFVKADSKYDLQSTFSCDLAALLSQMPHTLGLKEGMKVTSGKLSGTVSTVTKNGKRKVTGKASLEELKGTVDGKTIALQQPIKVEAEITAEKDKVIFDKVGFTASFGKIDCSGTSESLQYTADIDLSALQAQLGQFFDMGKYRFAGQVIEKGTISAKKQQITAVGSSTIKNLRITSKKDGASISEPQTDIEFAVGYDRKSRVVNIDSIKAITSFGQVDIKDGVVPIGKKAEKIVEMTVTAKVDLQKATPFAVMFASFPKKMQLAGAAESEVSIRFEKQGYRVATDATHIKNLKVNYPGQKPFEANDVSIVFDTEVNPLQKTVNVKKLQLISPQIKIHKGEFSQVSKDGKTKLEGRVDCEYDWAAVSTITAPYLPQGLKLEGQRKDSISFTCEYPTGQKDKLLENLNTKAKVGFAKAQYMGLNFGPTEVDIQIENGLLKIAPFSTTVNNGQLNFAAEADFKKKPILLKTTQPVEIKNVQVNEVMSRKLLVYVNPIFLGAVDVTGVANFSAERLAIPLAGASKNELEVIGTIDADKLKLKPIGLLGLILSSTGQQDSTVNMKIHPTRFVLQNGLLQYEDMQMDIGDNPVNFKGAIGLDNSVNMTVTLPYTMSGRTVRVGEKADDRISLSLTGTIDKPELDMGKLFEDQLKKQLEKQLLKGLEKLFE
ncbi:MAG: hypothetical protein FVQ85_00265 [Planctomycetes bacterium]|nr:hypothetical protein [Planctomycetota bacterium]